MSVTIFQNQKNAFLGYKKRRSKSRKTAIFPKGLTHGFGPKMAIFPTSFLQGKQGSRMSLTMFWNEKTHFQGIKTRSSKSRKIAIFVNQLTHGFYTKMAIFPTSFFQGKQGSKMSFTIFQNEKTPLQAIKTRSLKSRKIAFFAKRLTHGFGPNITIFPTSFFWQNRPGKCPLRYSRTKKTPFQAIKKRRSKSRKIAISPKGLTHGFGLKMAIFATFFFLGKTVK